MYKKFFIVTALVLGLAAGLAVAATQQAAGAHGHHNGWMLRQMTRELNLSDSQQAQIKTILQTEKSKTQPLRDQLRQNRMSRKNSVGTFDENEARSFASKQAQLMSDLMVERERTKSQIFAVLTPDQRQKAEQLMQQHRQMRRHQGPKRQSQSEQSPG